MLVVYKTGAIRVTPKFTRWLLGALIGVVALSLVNLVASLFTPGGLGLRSAENPALAIGFSLLCIGIAAFTFLLDFDMIDKGIRQGAPERFAWYAGLRPDRDAGLALPGDPPAAELLPRLTVPAPRTPPLTRRGP